MSFRGGRLRDFAIPASTVWLMTDIAEAKGRQDLYTRQTPQVLKTLREMALVQSVESSNRIEGVTVTPARLRPLVFGNAPPQDRSEEEIQGYRRACPGVSRDMVRRVLRKLQKAGKVASQGRGPGATWRRIG